MLIKRNNVSQDTFSAMIYTYFMHSLNKKVKTQVFKFIFYFNLCILFRNVMNRSSTRMG